MHSQSPSTATPITTGRIIRWAHSYDRFIRFLTFGRVSALHRSMLDRAELSSNATVLDIGCGTGNLCLLTKSRLGPSGTVVGIDASPEMVAYAQKKAAQAYLEIDIQLQAAEQLAFPDHSFDVVFSSLMLHHLPDTIKQEALRETWRVLRPQGRLVLMDFVFPTTWLGRIITTLTLHGHHLITTDDLETLLTKAGFGSIEKYFMYQKVFVLMVATKS